MKRTMAALLALALAFSLLAVPSAAAEQPQVTGRYFSLTLPETWEGKIRTEENEDNGRYGLSVFHLASYEKYGGGLLFSLELWDDWSFVTLPHFFAAGTLSDGEREKILVVQMPSDYQAAEGVYEEYNELYDEEAFHAIVETLEPAEGWTLGPVDELAYDAARSRFEYWNALLTAQFFNKTPDGMEILPEDWDGDMANNRFAVCDVNGDGRNELLISVEDIYIAGMRTLVYHLGDYVLEEELCVFPGAEFYGSGLARGYASHNHTYETAWPYTLYRFDPETRRYDEIASVYSWDRSISEEDYDGTAFPAEADEDGNGVIYHISDADGERWEDDAAYEAWEQDLLDGAEALEIDWKPYTIENIDELFVG